MWKIDMTYIVVEEQNQIVKIPPTLSSRDHTDIDAGFVYQFNLKQHVYGYPQPSPDQGRHTSLR